MTSASQTKPQGWRELPDPIRDYDELVDHLSRKHDYRTPRGLFLAEVVHIHANSHRFPRNVPHRHTHG